MNVKKELELELWDYSGHSTFKINVKNPASFISYVKEAYRVLFDIVNNKDKLKKAEKGSNDFRIVLMGFSQLSATFLALFHGYFGYFPNIKWYIRGKDGFTISSDFLNLQQLRYDGRSERGSDYTEDITKKIDQLEKALLQLEDKE